MSWDELRAVDELGEVGVGVVRHAQARQRPLLGVHLPTDLHVDQLHFLTVLQSLTGETVARLVGALTEIQFYLCIKDLADVQGHEVIHSWSSNVHSVFKENVPQLSST